MARRSQPARKRRSSVRADDVPVDASAPGKRRKVSHESDDGEVAMSETPKLNLEDQFKAIAAEAASQSNATDTGVSTRKSKRLTATPSTSSDVQETPRDSATNGIAPASETPANSEHISQYVLPSLAEISAQFEAEEDAQLLLEVQFQSKVEAQLAESEPEPKTQKGKEREVLEEPDDYDKSLNHAGWKEKRYWPKYDDNEISYYAADGETRYEPASQRETSGTGTSTGSPSRPIRGGRGGRGRGGGRGNGRGRPRGRPGRGKGDSPDPLPRKSVSPDQRQKLQRLKARQAELKRLFGVVGGQQYEVLGQLAAKDLSKMVRKPKAHTKPAEYTHLIRNLDQIRETRQEDVYAKYEIQLQHELERMESEKEVIESQYKLRCVEAKMEHMQGLQGDMALLKKAAAGDLDETRTESGSEIDFFPRYHEVPEADAHVRGFVSTKVTDEKPFKQYLESYDDQARQEVMDEDVTRPMIDALNKRNQEHREEEERKRTMNIDALSDEAIKELKRLEEMKGYLIPRPMDSAYALSALADVSDYVRQQHKDKAYIYMPLDSDQQFSSLPGQTPNRQLAPAPSLSGPSARFNPPRRPSRSRKTSKNSSISSVGPVRATQSLQPSPNGTAPPPSPLGPPPRPSLTIPPPISTGPGQPIAPAPPKTSAPLMASPYNRLPQTYFPTARHTSVVPPPSSLPPPPSPMQTQHAGEGQQLPKYRFQTPQSPAGAVAPSPGPWGMPRGTFGTSGSPTTPFFGARAGVPPPGLGPGLPGGMTPALPGSAGGSGGGGGGGTGQGMMAKIPVTFINQTPDSRRAAAGKGRGRKRLMEVKDKGLEGVEKGMEKANEA